MKISNLFKKKSVKMQEDVEKKNALKNEFKKVNSYMLAIPEDKEEINNVELIKERRYIIRIQF